MFVFIAMLFDPIVTIPMIVVGAMMRWQKMLVVAFVGAIVLSLMTASMPSGVQGVEGFGARFSAMVVAGLIGTVIYLRRMSKRARRARLEVAASQTEVSV